MHDSAELSKNERWRDGKESERKMGKLKKRGSQGEREGKESGPGSCVLAAQRASL